jgi:hypothetical protein
VGIAIDEAAYAQHATSGAESTADAAVLERIEDIQKQLRGGSDSSRPGVTGDDVPSWQAHAPKADLGVKADDGAPRGNGGGPDDAPYPEHFKAVIEAVTLGKPVPGVREIPDTVIRQPVSMRFE